MIVRRAGTLAKQNDCALPSQGSAIPSFNQAGKGQISRMVKPCLTHDTQRLRDPMSH